MEVATMTQSADDELAQLRAQRMAQIQSQLKKASSRSSRCTDSGRVSASSDGATGCCV